MAQKFLVSIDLNKNELQNARLQNLATAPSSPVIGQFYYDTTINSEMVWNGTAWIASDVTKIVNGTLPLAKLVTDPLARANHTGTQTASTISDFNAAVRTNRLDQMAAPIAAVNLNGQKITNLATPTVGSADAATAAYVDNAVQNAASGIDSKPSVRVLATANVALSALQTIDGVTVAGGDRVLLVGQTDPAQNGVYSAASGVWTRAIHEDQNGEISPGAMWFVEEGATYGRTQWRCNNTGTITLGTTAISIVQFGAASMYTAGDGLQLNGTEFKAKLVGNGGVLATASGLSVDRAFVPYKYSQTIGDGIATIITVTHSLNTQDVTVMVRDATTHAVVFCDIVAATTTTVNLSFASPPAANSLRVVVTG